MPVITLNDREIAQLRSAIRRGDDNRHFQEFLNTMGELLDDDTGEMTISITTFELIERYGSGVGKLSWHGILFSIFGRTASTAFGRSEKCTDLIDIDSGHSFTATGGRNYRVV